MINYILANKLFFADYVNAYTNASFVVNSKFSFKDGLFSGFDAKKKTYDKSTWAFELDANGVPVRDDSFKNPRCVLNLLQKHFERYTLDAVTAATGTSKEDLLAVYKAFASTGTPERSGLLCTPWATPRRLWACRTFAPCLLCSSCLVTLVLLAAA